VIHHSFRSARQREWVSTESTHRVVTQLHYISAAGLVRVPSLRSKHLSLDTERVWMFEIANNRSTWSRASRREQLDCTAVVRGLERTAASGSYRLYYVIRLVFSSSCFVLPSHSWVQSYGISSFYFFMLHVLHRPHTSIPTSSPAMNVGSVIADDGSPTETAMAAAPLLGSLI
jgi:hypothetical protein